MKIGIGADTGDFEKGARKVKQEMKDLNKVSSDAFAAIGNALGIDTRQIQQFSSALSGLGNKLGQTGTEGASAFSKIGGAVSAVGVGIAGLGLAAAIAAFKQLNAEADAFEATIQGGVIKAQTDAYISTFRQALRDQSGVGENVAGFRQTWKMAATTLAGAFQSGFDFDRMREANTLGERAKEIATELYNIDLRRKENSVKISELDAQIAQKREVISDTSRSAAERSAALAATQDLIKQKLDLQLPLAERQRDLIVEYNGLTSTTIKDYDAEIAAKISVNNLIQQEAAEQRSLLRQQTQINKALEEEKNLHTLIKQEGAGLESVPGVGLSTPGIEIPVELVPPDAGKIAEFKEHVVLDMGEIRIGIAIDPDSIEKIQDMSNQLRGLIGQMADGIGQSLGELGGALIKGENPWKAFSSAAISAFGEMATAIGKIAIEAGAASLGIQAALDLSPAGAYLAIAAGIALVALGTMVKSGLGNVANGNYSATSGMATSSATGTYSDYEQREVYVNVQGVLTADGDQLLAVINNTEKKNFYTK